MGFNSCYKVEPQRLLITSGLFLLQSKRNKLKSKILIKHKKLKEVHDTLMTLKKIYRQNWDYLVVDMPWQVNVRKIMKHSGYSPLQNYVNIRIMRFWGVLKF